MADSVFNLDFEKIAGEKLLQILGERTPTSIALLDRDYNVHYVNDRLASTLAFSTESKTGTAKVITSVPVALSMYGSVTNFPPERDF